MAWQDQFVWWKLVIFLVVTFLLISFAVPSGREALSGLHSHSSVDKDLESWCPLPDPPKQSNDTLRNLTLFQDEAALELQVERLSAAVNVPTQSYDDESDVDDKKWATFEQLHSVLEKLFPLVHNRLKLERVNKYGLLYTLDGSLQDLKPILFMAHQDVVPGGDPSKWKYDPFSAHFDGQWLWGRGSSDCKNNLIGLLSTMETLLAHDFAPKRSIMFSFGFDEEVGGQRGAAHLAPYIEKNLGKDSIHMIIDEGGMGINLLGDVAYALPATAEKGFLDIVMTLTTDGGHSSRPPPHTAIGIMSKLIVALEDHPFAPVITTENPFHGYLKCQAKYSPNHVESWLPKALKSRDPDLGPKIAESRGGEARWSIQTSQAVDIIAGGEQDNQLPGQVQTTINYRVLPTDDIDTLLASTADLVAPLAHSYGVAVDGFGYSDAPSAYPSGLLNLTTRSRLPASPITPSDAADDVWTLFAGSIRAVFEDVDTLPGAKMVVPVASIMTGNTDTQHYWNLSKHIFRFTPRREGTTEGVHGVDERVDMKAHLEGMRWYAEVMRIFGEREVE
ncbi:hypothetical protein M8818_004610 [Zalaria obscura]|uniref:Uncharacterized protein n=1 Tax=Zalaria obscura TaxID=2024903 RepID=A0ACC3SCE9_9PEZI